MANNSGKCSTSFVIINSILNPHKPIILLLEWLKFKKPAILNVGQVVAELELAFVALDHVKWYNHFGKVWQFLNVKLIPTT
jgi:hypothetical protein